MSKRDRKIIIGLMGGIASGKSTVAKLLEQSGCAVIDADEIAGEVLQMPDIKQQIVKIFGTDVFDASGRVDRKKLAEAAFADRKKISALNSIIHPFVFARSEELIAEYNRDENVKAIVLDMPLLLEVGWNKHCDKLLFVDCEAEIRLARAEKRAGFDEKKLKKRENFQISLDKKADIAHYTICNSHSLSELARQLGDLFPCLIDSR
ncbi:MAG: dephospho-CoA kinase [Planctomycetes bacterium]|nr:dephospho-CoA kinase [Planctomycetota bacterium]